MDRLIVQRLVHMTTLILLGDDAKDVVPAFAEETLRRWRMLQEAYARAHFKNMYDVRAGPTSGAPTANADGGPASGRGGVEAAAAGADDAHAHA